MRNARNISSLAFVILVAFAAMADTTRPSTRPVPAVDNSPAPLAPVSFLGVEDAAAKVVFVCDASGPMQSKLPVLRDQLRAAVAALKPIQSFDVIYMERDTPQTLGPILLPATDANKKIAAEFGRDASMHEETDPLPALDVAFAVGPDLIFLLTDGDFPDNEAVVARIQKLNNQKKVRIDTIAFRRDTEKDTTYFILLKQIAAQNGGKFAIANVRDFPPR